MKNPLSDSEPWSLVAAGYETDTMPVFRQYCEKAIEMAKIKADQSILDVACGPGTLSLLLHEKVQKIESIDFSPKMIQLLERTIHTHSISNINVTLMDGQQLKFLDNTFDRAFSMFGLIFFPDRKKGFLELYRTLKPKGKAIISSWAPIDHSPLMTLLFNAMGKAFPSKNEKKIKFLNLDNPTQIKNEMESAGFKNIQIEEFTGYWQINDVQEFLDAMIRGSVNIVMEKEAIVPEEWSQKYAIMLDYLRDKIKGTPLKLGSKAYIGMGVKS